MSGLYPGALACMTCFSWAIRFFMLAASSVDFLAAAFAFLFCFFFAFKIAMSSSVVKSTSTMGEEAAALEWATGEGGGGIS